jgi:hypothetical protein
MPRPIWLPLIALAACGTEDDLRPRSVEYVTQAILAPSCGNAQCHSSFRNADGYAFDTVERARRSLAGGLVGTITFNAQSEPVGDPAEAFLMTVLTRAEDRMPFDQPLPDADLDLIERWIAYGAPGAQCDPSAGDRVCVGRQVVQCDPDYNYGPIIQNCATINMNCSAGACR